MWKSSNPITSNGTRGIRFPAKQAEQEKKSMKKRLCLSFPPEEESDSPGTVPAGAQSPLSVKTSAIIRIGGGPRPPANRKKSIGTFPAELEKLFFLTILSGEKYGLKENFSSEGLDGRRGSCFQPHHSGNMPEKSGHVVSVIRYLRENHFDKYRWENFQ